MQNTCFSQGVWIWLTHTNILYKGNIVKARSIHSVVSILLPAFETVVNVVVCQQAVGQVGDACQSHSGGELTGYLETKCAVIHLCFLFILHEFGHRMFPFSHHLLCICLCEEKKNTVMQPQPCVFFPLLGRQYDLLSTTVLVAFVIGSFCCLPTVNVLFLATQSVQFNGPFATPYAGCDRCLNPGSIVNGHLVQPPTSKKELGVCRTHKG